MGRPAGSKNKSTIDVRDFVDTLDRRVNLLDKLETLLKCESEKVQAQVVLRLLEYRYGKPKESIELSGHVTYTEALAKMRAKRG
jgi:hypothetical protein